MPFTLAHAAASLPFRRTRLPVSAIVIGCLAPDLLYFMRLAPRGRFGHSLHGVLFLDLPIALGMYWIWRAYLRPGTLAVAVSPERGLKAIEERRWSVGSTLIAVAAILLGIASHLLWDSFTHIDSWPYWHSAFLRHVFTLPLLGEEHGYDLMQNLSSVGGLVILGLWLRNHWWDDAGHVRFHISGEWRRRALAACLIAAACGVARGLWGTRGLPWQHSWLLIVVEFLVAGMAVLFAEWLLAAMIVTYRLTRSR